MITSPMTKKVPRPAVSFSAARNKSNFVAIFSCDDMGGDSFLVGNYLASRLSAKHNTSLILSISNGEQLEKQLPQEAPMEKKLVQQLTLDWDELQLTWHEPERLVQKSKGTLASTVFLASDLLKVPEPEKLTGLLDQCVLFVQPTFESLRECYRIIKMTLKCNPSLEYFLIYDGAASDAKSVTLFSELTGFVQKRLGVEVRALGCLEKMKSGESCDSELNLEPLFLKSEVSSNEPEKKALEALIAEAKNKASEWDQKL